MLQNASQQPDWSNDIIGVLPGSRVQIIVSDTGQGIASDFLPHLFKSYSQADPMLVRSEVLGLV